jgi:hypothetical protein
MTFMKKKTIAFAAGLVMLSATISGCCSGPNCGLLGKSSTTRQQVVTPSACSTCSLPVAIDQYHADVAPVSNVVDLAPTRVARAPQLLPSWVGSSPVSTPKSCGST